MNANDVVLISQRITEVNADFSRTMNKIIFDKYLEEQINGKFYTKHIRLFKKQTPKKSPYLGKMELEKNKGAKLIVIERL